MSSFPPAGSDPPPGDSHNPFGPNPNPFAPNPNPFAPNPNPFATQPIPPLGSLPPYYPNPSRISKLAVVSLVAAIVSPAGACLCIPALLLSLSAVVGGHVAIVRINRSQRTLTGLGAAIAALVLGYPMLLLCLALAPSFVTGLIEGMNEATENSAASDPLAEAERKILTAGDGAAHGNSPEAIELAQQYSTALKALREAAFTKRDKPGLSLSRGEFVVYCQLSPGKCAFLVHVPDYRNFDADAKDTLADLAWITAQHTVADTLQPGDSLGVGLKGVVLYGSVQVGEVVATDAIDEKAGIHYVGEDEDKLKFIFEPVADEPPPPDPSADPPLNPSDAPNGELDPAVSPVDHSRPA